jgi:hypothetical protein
MLKIKQPLWSKVTFVILFGTLVGAYISGESTRKLDDEYIRSNIHSATQLATTLLASILSESVVLNDTKTTDALIKESIKEWPEVTYIHIEDDRGLYYTEWGKLDIVGLGIQKFETPVILGGQHYGVLCVYADLRRVYENMDSHINEVRNRSALILLAIALFIIAIVDLLITQKNNSFAHKLLSQIDTGWTPVRPLLNRVLTLSMYRK